MGSVWKFCVLEHTFVSIVKLGLLLNGRSSCLLWRWFGYFKHILNIYMLSTCTYMYILMCTYSIEQYWGCWLCWLCWLHWRTGTACSGMWPFQMGCVVDCQKPNVQNCRTRWSVLFQRTLRWRVSPKSSCTVLIFKTPKCICVTELKNEKIQLLQVFLVLVLIILNNFFKILVYLSPAGAGKY